jgi:hypothetical protein
MKHPVALGPLLFLLETFLCQVIACGGAVVAWDYVPNGASAIFASTIVATTLALLLRLPTSWVAINTLLPPSIAVSLCTEIPGWFFLGPLAILLCVYAPAFWTRVPYYPTSKAAYPLILADLPPNTPFTFIDIGCGFGDLLFFLSKHRPNGTFVGIEIGVLPYLCGKARARIHGRGNVTISFSDLSRYSLSSFDYVYAFLSPAAMPRVWQKAVSEMPAGSTFITNSFETPAEATYKVDIKDSRGSTLFIHRIKGAEPMVRC